MIIFFKCLFKWFSYVYNYEEISILNALQKNLSEQVQPHITAFKFNYNFWYAHSGYCFNVLACKNVLDPCEKYVSVLSSW